MNALPVPDALPRPYLAGWRWRYLRDVLGTLVGLAGPELSLRLARALAREVFDLHPPIRQIIERHLEEAGATTLDPQNREELARGVFENVAMFWAEVLSFRRRLSPGTWERMVRINSAVYWHELAAASLPAILVTGYVGNPVAAACALSCMIPPLHVVVDPVAEWLIARNPRVWRRFRGLRLVPVRRAAEELPAVLDDGGRVLMIVGRPTTVGGVEATFLGRRARHSAAIAHLAHRHGASIILFACHRVLNGAMRFELSEPVCLPPESFPPTAAALTQACLDVLERFIRREPAQYLWTRR